MSEVRHSSSAHRQTSWALGLFLVAFAVWNPSPVSAQPVPVRRSKQCLRVFRFLLFLLPLAVAVQPASAQIGPGGGDPEVWLIIDSTNVAEGAEVTVKVRQTLAQSSAVVIPVTLTNGTAEDGDYAKTLTSITIAANQNDGTATIATNHDADMQDETFTVALGTPPGSLTKGSPSSIQVTIIDDDKAPTVSLSAAPNPVEEGSAVTVRATLSSTLQADVQIPLTVTRNTSEPGDHGTLTSITIRSGASFATGRITANLDTDTLDEQFTVALASNLPNTVTAGTSNSVKITITDVGVTVNLAVSPTRVTEGATVGVSATLSVALGSDVTIPLTVTRNSSEAGDHGTLDEIRISAGQTTGYGTITTFQDDDVDDEQFTVELGSLPSSVTAGTRTLFPGHNQRRRRGAHVEPDAESGVDLRERRG